MRSQVLAQVRVSARVKGVIEVDGLRFKDLDADGQLTPYEDWRLSPAERAADLVSRMTPDEKVGLMAIVSRTMGLTQGDSALTSHDGLLDEEHHPVWLDPHNSSGKPYEGTTEMITGLHLRHFVLRESPRPSDIARWVNAMNEVAEGTRLGIPVLVAANSKNEAGQFSMAKVVGDPNFTLWPGTLGLAAAHDVGVVEDFAERSRAEWVASGLRKGYMYMADVLTDPRWFRGRGTFGEDPAAVAEATGALVRGFQGEHGLERDGVALTTKHFPGGGARENGFDPHYAEGRFNAYPTPGSLAAYHLPPFRAAVEAGTSSVMPYYAIPSRERSSLPQDPLVEFEPVGFTFGAEALRVLREMGHRGYVNSDSGVLSKMPWGVEDLSVPERVGLAVSAGTDLFGDTNDVASIREAYLRGLFSHERLDEAARLLTQEMFALGLFDDPYVDPDAADDVVRRPETQAAAADAHRRSVVLLKNSGGALPLTPQRSVYVGAMADGLLVTELEGLRRRLARAHPDLAFTTDHVHADVAVVFLDPSAGAYFRSAGLLDLGLDAHSHVDLAELAAIRASVETLVVVLNVRMPWLLGTVEPLADALVMGFDTRREVLFDAVVGAFTPTGRLPVTFPRDQAAVAVDDDGRCASPNDVPGYAKEAHMDGRPYVYVDSEGHRYELGFGLTP